MRTLSPFLPLMIFAIILATIHLSSCRQVTWASYQETQQKLRTKFSFSFPEHFSASSPSVSGNQNLSRMYVLFPFEGRDTVGSWKERIESKGCHLEVCSPL
ncbi:hypothetical protein CRYUN_Cryun07bG0100200 [Craigia yunnanensis]